MSDKTTATQDLPRVEIFAAGTHTDMNGKKHPFSNEDVAEIASSYDPAHHEAPMIVGHPNPGVTSMPAYGWVTGLAAEGGKLFAQLGQVPDTMRDAMKAAHYKKFSPGILPRNHPANPTPGKLHLEHLAILGATPPAVKGLEAFQFAAPEGDEAVMCFAGEQTDWILLRVIKSLRGLVRTVRNTVTEEEAADLPTDDDIDFLRDQARDQMEAARSQSTNQDAAHFAAAQQPKEETTNMAEKTEDELKAERDQLEADKKAHDTAVAEFAAQQAEREKAADKAIVDKAVAEGRLPAGEADAVMAFAATLEADESVICFAAPSANGDGEAKVAPRTWFRDHLAALPVRVPQGELTQPDPNGDAPVAQFAAPAGFSVNPELAETHQKAVAYQAAHPNTDYADAVAAVS